MHKVRGVNRAKSVLILSLLAIIVVSCGEPAPQAKPCNDPNKCATPTIYYTPTINLAEMTCPQSELISIHDGDDRVIVQLCEEDFEDVRLNGAGRILDGTHSYIVQYQSYNIAKDQHQFFYKNGWEACEYACGASGLCLEPYFSIAADRNIYPFGTIIYIPVLDGVVLPDGRRHDGHVRVEDTGGAIKDVGRFDFYTGDLNHYTFDNPFIPLGLSDKSTRVEYSVVSTPDRRATGDRECRK